MNTISSIDFYDFYFNGHYLSEFGGIIGGLERLSKYPLLPSRVYTVDRAIGQDGVTVFDSYLEPRTFEVPVFFDEIDYVGIRKISGWLNTKSDEWFYFKDDTLKIKCTLDSDGTFLETITGNNGYVSLKFIAHDPYYYEVNNTTYTYDGLTQSVNRFNLLNNGNEVSYPFVSIWGTGTVTVNVYKGDMNTLYNTCTISGLITGVQLDTKYRTCTTQSGTPLFNNFSGTFPILPTGNYILETVGTVSKVFISPNFRFV